MPRAPKSPLLAIFFTVFIDLVGVGIVIPVLAPLFLSPDSPLAAPGWSFATRTLLIGMLSAIYPIAQFFGAPYLGALSDRLGRKPVLLMSLVGTFIGYLFFGLAIKWSATWLLFLSRALDGFTGGNISTAQSAISDVSTPQSKPRNFALVGMAYGMGFILGPYIGGKLASAFNPATPFWFAAALTVVNIGLVLWRFDETLRTKVRTRMSMMVGFENIGKAFRLADVRIMFLVGFLLTLGFNFFTQFFQVLAIEKYAFTEAIIGNMYAYVGVWVALTLGIATDWVSRRWRPRQVLPWSLLLLSLTLAALALPRDAWVLYVITPFMALGMGLSQPNTTTIISSLADKKSQGEILGINTSVNSVATAVPPIIAGVVAAFNIYLPIVLAAFFVFLAWLVFVRVFKRQSHHVFTEV